MRIQIFVLKKVASRLRKAIDNKYLKVWLTIFCKIVFGHKGSKTQRKMRRIFLLRAFAPLWLTSFRSVAEKKLKNFMPIRFHSFLPVAHFFFYRPVPYPSIFLQPIKNQNFPHALFQDACGAFYVPNGWCVHNCYYCG